MKVSLIGLGLMGLPMAQRLLASGLQVTVYNRTAEKVFPLQEVGVKVAETPQDAIAVSDCTILILSDANAIASTLFSDPVKSVLPGKAIIQMGTISPTQSKAISTEIIGLGGEYLEAPVLGSIPEVKSGTLLVMVGANPDQFQRFLPVFKLLGESPLLMGEVGKASALKLALNQLIASLTIGFSSSLALVQRSGVDVEQFMQILRQSALYAPTFDKKLQRMLDRNYDHPNFPTKHLLKDVNLCLDEAESLGVDSSLMVGLQQVLEKAIAHHLQDLDYSAVYDAVNPAD